MNPSLLAPDPDFGILAVNVKEIPPPTAEDIEEKKDPEAYERRELAKLWKEERTEFNQLKRLAHAVGIERVFVSPYSASPELKGWYVYCGWEVDSLSARRWGLSHEIGHHIFRLAEFTERERNASVSEAMRRFFPFDTYLHQSRDEICAECFAEYLTVSTIKSSIERHCDSVLRQVRVHNPYTAKLIESYRRTVLL
jgi:hypothetical protein